MIILMTGQSNAAGRGNLGPSTGAVDSRVKVWNNQNDSTDIGSAFISSPGLGNDPWARPGVGTQNGSTGGNNLGAWFADRAARELNEEIWFVLVAQGGQRISNWEPGEGAIYNRIQAVWSNTSLGEPADVLLWHQGESDGGLLTVKEYKERFLEVISGMRADGLIKEEAPVIAGEVDPAGNPARADINQAFEELEQSDPLIYFARNNNLTTFDDLHYEGSSLYSFGYSRYWGKYREHTGPRSFVGFAGVE